MTKRVFKFLLFIFVFAMAAICKGQEQRGMVGMGVSVGVVNYQGELDDHFALKFSHLGYGVHATALFFKRVHIRLALFRGRLEASDADAVYSSNKNRNLNFITEIDEASLVFMYKIQNKKHSFTKRNFVTPYIFAGGGGFYFNPQADYFGGRYDLQPLGTEGQYLGGAYPQPYKLFQFCIPFGGGILIKISEHLDVGGEVGFRKTFTDYLDDVSTTYPDKDLLIAKNGPRAVQLSDRSLNYPDPKGRPAGSPRGNPKDNDWYEYSNIHITYYFTTSLFKPYKRKNRFKGDTCKGLMTPKKIN